MTTILTDMSDDVLHQVSLDHFYESQTCFSVVADVDVVEREDIIRIISPGIPNWLTNAVFRCRIPAGDVDSVIDEISTFYSTNGVAPYWRICSDDQPADLEERLTKKGYVLKAEQIAMAVDLERLNENITTPEGFVIERVTSEVMLREKHAAFRQVGEGKSFGSLLLDLFNAYGYDADSDWQHYVGLLDDEPVTYASLFYATGVAGIYDVGTLPEARGQGLGSAITLRPLLDARECGYRVGMLQSSKMGLNVYKRLGFKDYFPIKFYAPAEPDA